jgi:GDPmannose 4,6-dehydratase
VKTKTAVITGVTGQDGSYLSDLLLSKDYEVIGLARRTSTYNKQNIEHLLTHRRFKVVEAEITDPTSISGVINEYKPDEFYNLAAQSHVGTSFDQPSFTFQVNAVGVLNCLEAIRQINPSTKFYQASTSEMFGENFSLNYHKFETYKNPNRTILVESHTSKEQNETTPFSPNSPYAVAKAAAHYLVQNYRRAYKLHASCGILFNHESPRRGENFVTQKIVKWIADNVYGDHEEYKLNPLEPLKLGNLDASRDWGYAGDYVEAMWS